MQEKLKQTKNYGGPGSYTWERGGEGAKSPGVNGTRENEEFKWIARHFFCIKNKFFKDFTST